MGVSETTSQSWFSRLGNAFKGIIVGFVVIALGIYLLFWNEGRAIKRYKALKEGAANVVSVQSDNLDSANDGKLVYTTGKTATDDVLSDDEFGVSVNAIKLERSVQMYQWAEKSQSRKKKNLGGSEETVTTYTYHKTWSNSLIDSSSFKESGHDNPSEMKYEAATLIAENVTLGVYRLSPSLINQIDSSVKYPIKAEVAPAVTVTSADSVPVGQTAVPGTIPAAVPATVPAAVPGTIPAAAPAPTSAVVEPPVGADADTVSTAPAVPVAAPAVPVAAPAVPVAAPAVPVAAPAVPVAAPAVPVAAPAVPVAVPAVPAVPAESRLVYQDGYYIGLNPAQPTVGDLKVTFRVVYPKEVSVISQQQDDTFVPYQAKTGTVELLSEGIVSCDQMFASAQSSNQTMAWILRVVGFFLILIGFNMVLAPLSVVADVIPLLGSIVGAGVGFAAFMLAASVSLLTIALGWLTYRPLIGGPLLILAVVAFVWLFMSGKKAKNAA